MEFKMYSTFSEMLKEVAPVGSFEDLRAKVRIQIEAVVGKDPFTVKIVDGVPVQTIPWIVAMFPNKVIVEWMDETFQFDFKVNKKGVVSLGVPKKVEQVFQVKESKVIHSSSSIKTELKEAGIAIVKEAKNADLDVNDFISLKEAHFDSDTGELEVILIEQGTNMGKGRHYPDSAIREAASSFSGLKMYIDHPTAAEEKAKPERSIKDWASTIVESHYDGGKAIAKIAVHDSWLRERLSDSVFRGNIGLSINASGKISYGKVNGKEMQIIEKILMFTRSGPASVDWVTEAGARGRVSRLLKESNTGRKKKMEIQEATFEDVERENPGLVKSIIAKVKESIQKSGDVQKKEKDLKEAQEENKKLKDEKKLDSQKKIVESALNESKSLPEATKARIVSQFESKLFESDVELKEAVAKSIKSELEYVNQFSQKGKIQTGNSQASNDGGVLDGLQESLDKRAGVHEEKKKDEDDE